MNSVLCGSVFFVRNEALRKTFQRRCGYPSCFSIKSDTAWGSSAVLHIKLCYKVLRDKGQRQQGIKQKNRHEFVCGFLTSIITSIIKQRYIEESCDRESRIWGIHMTFLMLSGKSIGKYIVCFLQFHNLFTSYIHTVQNILPF